MLSPGIQLPVPPRLVAHAPVALHRRRRSTGATESCNGSEQVAAGTTQQQQSPLLLAPESLTLVRRLSPPSAAEAGASCGTWLGELLQPSTEAADEDGFCSPSTTLEVAVKVCVELYIWWSHLWQTDVHATRTCQATSSGPNPRSKTQLLGSTCTPPGTRPSTSVFVRLLCELGVMVVWWGGGQP